MGNLKNCFNFLKNCFNFLPSEDDMINASTNRDKILFLPGPLFNYHQQKEALSTMNGIDPIKLNEVLQQIARKQRHHSSGSESEGPAPEWERDQRSSSLEGDPKSPYQGMACG
jgi:hypothetical protein